MLVVVWWQEVEGVVAELVQVDSPAGLDPRVSRVRVVNKDLRDRLAGSEPAGSQGRPGHPACLLYTSPSPRDS